MGNIHSIFKEDDVNGKIIGGYYFKGQVFYSGRPQSKVFSGYTKEELQQKLEERLSEIKGECKSAFDMIYPKKEWEFRYYE